MVGMEVTSHITLNLPSLKNAILIGRGGALFAAARAGTAITATPESHGVSISEEGKAVALMAIAMSLHYLGYALARPITVALFTSSTTGYAGFAAAFPFAMAFVSPASLLLLLGYGKILETYGPYGTLMRSTFLCSSVMTLSSIAVAFLSKTQWKVGPIAAVKLVTGPLFIFRESYVQLITSQHWGFMASVLSPNQSARWFAPISGLTSMSSALAGLAVAPLVARFTLPGALLGTGLMLLLSMFAASGAYKIARKHGFEPAEIKRITHRTPRRKFNNPEEHVGMVAKARNLFARVPVLGALFREILVSQGLSTALNVCFVARLGSAIPDDTERAGWVGMYYALINATTMLLQFGLLPMLMTMLEPRSLWRALPIVTMCTTAYQSIHADPSLFVVSASLFVMRVSEYSVRRMLDELIYVPLDFESRFVGKEVISVFGFRFGKSLMSLALSGLTAVSGEHFGLQQLSLVSNVVSLLWMRAAWSLSNHVPTRQEAEDAYKVSRRKR